MRTFRIMKALRTAVPEADAPLRRLAAHLHRRIGERRPIRSGGAAGTPSIAPTGPEPAGRRARAGGEQAEGRIGGQRQRPTARGAGFRYAGARAIAHGMNETNSGHDRLHRRMARGAAFLGSRGRDHGGAMSWVSERNLVAAMSNAGGFGVIACGAMTVELLDREIAATKALTSKPFGVNLITMHPDLIALIEVCAKHAVGHVVLAGGLPPKGSLEAIKALARR